MTELPATIAGFEAEAHRVADPFAWDYLARGSGTDLTLHENAAAWDRWKLLPRVLRDVTLVDTATTVLGDHVEAPILVAPTAMHRLFCEDGELATARAAAAVRSVMIVSMFSTVAVEDVVEAVPTATCWAQMYMLRDRSRTRALAERARDAGYRAIVASVDGAAVGRGGAPATAGTLSPPEWMRYPNLAPPGHADTSDIMRLVSDFDPSITFADLARFGEWSGLPVVVKGILRADDAAAAVDAGAAAIAVSNHGGRIFDGLAATADVLPEIVDAVGGRAEVYVDGGIRSGAHVGRALALGATAVLSGRPVLWGLVVDGEHGARRVLELLCRELEATMAFSGARTVGELTRDLARGG